MVNLKIEVPSNFLEEEVRDGYKVSSQMKQVWAVQLDLLKIFIDICEKYQLKYFADSGTLLGAVRHGGMIPWDDDIDVAMPREDYNKLCKCISQELKYPYFWQTEDADPGSVRGHAQLRNSETTGILNSEKNKKYQFNQGIFIDIFPLDKVPKAVERESFFRELYVLKAKSLEYANDITRTTYAGQNPYYKQFEEIVQKYNQTESQKVGLLSLAVDRYPFRNKKDYDTTEKMRFEFLEIVVPGGYKNILRTIYGKWGKPAEEPTAHGQTFFDAEKSYMLYVK